MLQTRQDPASYLQLQRPLRERTGFLIAETVGASTARVARSVDVFCAGTEGDQTKQSTEGGRSLLCIVLQNNTFFPLFRSNLQKSTLVIQDLGLQSNLKTQVLWLPPAHIRAGYAPRGFGSKRDFPTGRVFSGRRRRQRCD